MAFWDVLPRRPSHCLTSGDRPLIQTKVVFCCVHVQASIRYMPQLVQSIGVLVQTPDF